MKIIYSNSFADGYRKWLHEIFYNTDYMINTRKLLVKEKTNLILQIANPYLNLFNNVVRKYPKKYLAGELLWYFSGRNDIEFISKYSKFWKKIANEDGTANSAYGYLLFVEYPIQFEWAKRALLKDKYTRQAIIHFNKPHHQKETKDFVCTIYGNFMIRDDKLHLSMFMRSSDAIYGITFDVPFFTLLQQIMLLELKQKYKDLSIGLFTLFVNSAHIYEKHFELVEQMLKFDFVIDALPKIKVNPILHKDLDLIIQDKYGGDDEFFKWLQKYK